MPARQKKLPSNSPKLHKPFLGRRLFFWKFSGSESSQKNVVESGQKKSKSNKISLGIVAKTVSKNILFFKNKKLNYKVLSPRSIYRASKTIVLGVFYVFRYLFVNFPYLPYILGKNVCNYFESGGYREFAPTCVVRSVRRHFPLFLAVVFLSPAAILIAVFVLSKLGNQSAFAANFTGAVRVSKQSTTLSTAGDWYKAMAYSGDGINGDAESGTFNPIHPGGTTDGSSGGLAVGYVVQAATTTYAAAQYVGFKPNATGNLAGVQLVIENLTSTSLANTDIVLELLRFPSATCTSSCSNYVTGTQGAYTYPSDTVILARTAWQHNQALSGENIQPGNAGRAVLDFRFDTPVAVTTGGGTGDHYGIRIINMGASAPVFGTWAQAPQSNGFPTINGTIRTIYANDIDLTNSPTVTFPAALAGNTVLTTSAMVAANSAAGVGMATVRRTENEHWTATYSTASSNWTMAGSVSGTQTNKLTTATNGGTGASWVNDGVTKTTLSADSTASTRLCVASITGFAVNQYIDIWDSDTVSIVRTISTVNATDGSCSGSGPSIIVSSALVANDNYTVSKNATVATATWKQRIVQGAVQAFSQDMPTTTKICVADSTQFSAPTAGTANNIAVWDNNSAIAGNRVVSTSQADGSCSSSNSITVATAITAATMTTAQNATVAEISANISNNGTPSNGAVLRYTTVNHPQNPTGSTLLARTTSVAIAYAKTEAVATSNVVYPFLSNRHIFFVAYGDADTSAPADGDVVIVGNARPDPDTGDSSNLTTDLNWSTKQSHVVTIDRSWDAAMAYSGYNGGAINNGAGSRTNWSAWSQNGGWVSALISPGSQLGIADTANAHYRITIPGKIVVTSDASVAFGTDADPIPSSSMHDIYFDNIGPAVSTTLTVNSAASTTLTVTSTADFRPGDTIVLDDNDSVPITRIIGAIESATSLTITAAAVTGYDTAQSAFVARGPTTELPTGQDRMAGVATMTGLITTTQNNARAGRVSLYGKGSESLRTSKSDLAVDIDGNVDTGYLGNNLTDSGQTWVDVEDDVVGNWQPLDQISVAGGTNQVADNNFSSIGMGGTDDANQMPVWSGLLTAGGKNALPTPNTETAEIGTIPMTNIYNSDYNGGSPLYSSNYNNTQAWTIFNDGANTEVNDAVYFGDQGNNMFYALELNLGTAMNASANYVWEYYKTGVGWTQFTPRDAYTYQTRTGVTLPLSVNTVRNSYTATLATGGTVFGLDQIVMIDDNDSPPIYRRLGTTAPTATTLTFAEPITADYTTAQGATVTRLNGGQWKSMNPASIFTSGTGRRMVSWTPSDLGGTAAKTTINSANAYWVRARISSFTSWTTSPTNQTTPVGMGGIERISSGAITVTSGVQEAKVTEVTPGASYDPNETWTLEYGNSPGWIEAQRYTSAQSIPSAPYVQHISTNGTLDVNATNLQHQALHNGSLTWTDYTVSALVKMDMVPDATNRRLGVMLRQSLDGNGYAALINKTNAANTIGWYSTLAGVPTLIGTATTKAFTEDTWYCLKAQVTGTTLNAKFWATTDCTTGEPGSWDETETNATYTTGRLGLYTGSATASQGMKANFDTVTTDGGFSDSFTDTGTWRVVGSIHGSIGPATPGTPFSSSYINFTIKHKGGRDGVGLPEIGDKIYLSSTGIRSYKDLTVATGITTSNANTKYETWDFEWNPNTSTYAVTGSATGEAGSATPGTTYTSPNSEISLKINSGTPTATKFGNRMLLLQGNMRRNTGAWAGNNGLGSAALVYPTYTLTSSAIATRYNIEGQAGTATARQRGTIDFWFKTNYSGSPSSTEYPSGMYLVDYANQGDTDRLFVRHNPNGTLEAAVYAAAAQGTLLSTTFSATAGQWYHFRMGWDESANAKRAWLDGTAFTTGQASTVGTRGANAGLIRIGNRFLYNAPFNGSIDEFAVFDEDIDTSGGCDFGNFTPPTAAWTGGETTGCTTGKEAGVNLFRASFDADMNTQEGWVWADYAFGNPAIIFTNGADTGNERIRVITYPQRTRVWVDNSGDKYTPSARIKAGSGYQENAALATLTGWSNNFMYHHKAAKQSSTAPTYSPVLNLRRSTHIWSDEPITQTGATMGAPINAGMGLGMGTIGLSGLATVDISDVSMENQYTNFAVVTNPFTSLAVKPSQTFTNSVFYNFYDRAYTVSGKTQGTNYVGAYFVTTHFAAANIGTGYNAGTSQNVGIDGSIFMGNRNAYVTVPPVAANGAASFYSGRLYSITNSEFYNNGITGAGTSGALNLGTGVAKVTISDNIFSLNTQGIRLYGNAFIDMSDNIFDGHTSDDQTTLGSHYGSGIRSAQSFSSVGVTDTGSIFGRGLWNEADINLPPNTTTFEAESLLQFTGEGTQFLSPVLFGTVDYSHMNRLGDTYLGKTIPGADIRGNYSSNDKDIVNFTTLGIMSTTGTGLTDTTVRTGGGYGWRMEPTDSDAALDYKIKVVGVANKPLAVTGYIRLNSNYGSTNLPNVTLSGLGMVGANLTWTAAATADTWQQFVVSGTPTESALAELKISGKLDYVESDSGTSEIISNPTGNYLPGLLEDNDKTWTANQWVGYKLKDANGKIFEIVKNTDKLLYFKGTSVPHLLSTTLTAATPGDYVIYNEPYFYIDDVSVLSGSVDTGTLDFHSSGQPVSPWLSTGLTAEGVWNAQFSSFADSDGSFGQLLGDSLVAKYADVSDPSPTTTEFDTNLTASTNDFYNNGVIIFTEGANQGVVRRISDYVGASKTITVDPALTTAPADGDRFAVLAATSSSAGGGGGATAAEIWSYALRQLTTEDLEGGGSLATAADIAALNNISASDVWSYANRSITDPDAIWEYALTQIGTAGSVGKLLKDNIDAAITSRSSHSASDIWSVVTRTLTSNANFNDPTSAQNAQAVWEYAARTLTDYGNDITAAEVWDTLSSTLITAGSIGKQLADNIDVATSTRASQSSLDAFNNISAADVWSYATRTITGEVALTSASRAAIWDTACSILNTSGSVGKRVCDNLDAAVTSRSTLTAGQVWSEATRTITGLESPALAAIASNVWANATRSLTDYGNDITAEDVWDVLTSSLTTIDSIGKLLVTNVDGTISSRSTQTSVDNVASDVTDVATDVTDIDSKVDTTVSSRASQASLDSHESSEATFRTNTTATLGVINVNVAAVLTQLSTIETKIDSIQSTLTAVDTKIDTIDTNLDSVKTTVEDTNAKVTAMQSVTDDILAKWGSYDAATLIGYVDTLETKLGASTDADSVETVFGKLNYIKNNGGGGGSGTIDLIYTQAQATHAKLLEVQTELGFNGKSTTAYDEFVAVKGYVDSVETTLATLDSRTASIASSVTSVSNDLKTVTERIGKVSVDSFTQLFEVKSTDIEYLKNKIIELKAMADIDRLLLEKVNNQPIVKVVMEWGSVIIKFVIVNPSDSTTQTIPFKAFLPKEVKQEYIMDLGGLAINYDTSTEQYYVTADITLEKGESVTRSVEIKDIWIISEDEITSLRKQANDLADGLKNTSYNAQGITLKTDINTRLDKVARKQKDNNATPQDHILAFRENQEDMMAIQDNVKGLKDLVLNSGAGNNFLASIGGIQTFATWGIVLALIFGMGTLGMFYYQLWKRKIVTVTDSSGKKTKKVELPTPMPHELIGVKSNLLRKILFGWIVMIIDIFKLMGRLVKMLIPHRKQVVGKASVMSTKMLVILLISGVLLSTIVGGAMMAKSALKKNQAEVMGVTDTALTPTPVPFTTKEEKVNAEIAVLLGEAAEKKKTNEQVEELIKKTESKESSISAKPDELGLSDKTSEQLSENVVKEVVKQKQLLVIQQTPTDWLNVRKDPSIVAEVTTKVYPGESYPYSEVKSGWYKILLKDLSEGWVSSEYAVPEKDLE